MSAQRHRLKIISSNIANANTTRTPGGGPYRRREVVFGALPPEKSFLEELKNQTNDQGARHVKVLGVVEDARPPKMMYDPAHPDANEEGYVAMPNIDVAEEMTNLMMAKRSFEANVAAMNATKQMISKALDIGR
jgi:flagellar basal-body rod protein FlgC